MHTYTSTPLPKHTPTHLHTPTLFILQGWEELKEDYPGVDEILSFLTSSNMFLAETVREIHTCSTCCVLRALHATCCMVHTWTCHMYMHTITHTHLPRLQVITMDLMKQMMESVPDRNYKTILKYLKMFRDVPTKFATFPMLIENLKRCGRNDKSLV